LTMACAAGSDAKGRGRRGERPPVGAAAPSFRQGFSASATTSNTVDRRAERPAPRAIRRPGWLPPNPRRELFTADDLGSVDFPSVAADHRYAPAPRSAARHREQRRCPNAIRYGRANERHLSDRNTNDDSFARGATTEPILVHHWSGGHMRLLLVLRSPSCSPPGSAYAQVLLPQRRLPTSSASPASRRLLHSTDDLWRWRAVGMPVTPRWSVEVG
jgi:hypothetical protein